MAEFNEDLARWFQELQKIPADHHLLCPKISQDDDENYKSLDDLDSRISIDEKKARIKDAERRIEITYWNSLIFGFEKKHAGKWLEEFTTRLEHSLRLCSDCVLNWHMKRRTQLQKFSEYVSHLWRRFSTDTPQTMERGRRVPHRRFAEQARCRPH